MKEIQKIAETGVDIKEIEHILGRDLSTEEITFLENLRGCSNHNYFVTPDGLCFFCGKGSINE